MIENIIENVKNLSQDDLVKFKLWFDENYCQLYDSKISPDQVSKFNELGDKICEMLGTVGFPLCGVGKCYDSPYSNRVCEDYELWETFEEILYSDGDRQKIPDYIWDKIVDMTIEMWKIGDSSWFLDKDDANDLYPGNYKYIFYVKGGKRKEVNDSEFEKCMKQG